MIGKKLYGLIGYPLGHSFSEKCFCEKFQREGVRDAQYRAFPLEDISHLPTLIASNPDLCGLNVTIPYKQTVIPYLDWLDAEAERIGAVNCISISDGKLKGYNTDAYGFRITLLDLIGSARLKALVLGSGGASRAVCHVLSQLGIEYLLVSRIEGPDKISYDQLTPQTIHDYKLIVNTTPLGTYPNVDAMPPIPYSAITADHFLYDLVYNPPKTAFLSQGATQGAATINGYGMLVAQAERSWQIWQQQD